MILQGLPESVVLLIYDMYLNYEEAVILQLLLATVPAAEIYLTAMRKVLKRDRRRGERLALDYRRMNLLPEYMSASEWHHHDPFFCQHDMIVQFDWKSENALVKLARAASIRHFRVRFSRLNSPAHHRIRWVEPPPDHYRLGSLEWLNQLTELRSLELCSQTENDDCKTTFPNVPLELPNLTDIRVCNVRMDEFHLRDCPQLTTVSVADCSFMTWSLPPSVTRVNCQDSSFGRTTELPHVKSLTAIFKSETLFRLICTNAVMWWFPNLQEWYIDVQTPIVPTDLEPATQVPPKVVLTLPPYVSENVTEQMRRWIPSATVYRRSQ